jgi:Uncharacterised nucleotidyltransferase
VTLTPEWKVLLALAKANVGAEDIRLAKQEWAGLDLDWDFVTTASYAHGIAPLIYHGLDRSGLISLLPAAAAEALRRSYYANAARNSHLYAQLHHVVEAFREQRIEVIFLKGAALAETVYPNRVLRAMTDIDLLVRKERLAEVETKLVAMGYVLEERGKTKEFYQQHHYHWEFRLRSAANVEIHWQLGRPTGSFRIDIDSLWERAQPTQIAGVEALALSPEDLLLHLCQHVWKHNLIGGIRPFCDIAETTRCYGDRINWRKLHALSSQMQMNACAYLGLRLAKELLDAPVPGPFLNELKPDNFDSAIISWARERVLAHPAKSLFSPDFLALLWTGYSSKERVTALQRILSPGTVTKWSRSPAASESIVFSYPRRIRYLAHRYGALVWRLLSGNLETRAAAEREENQRRLTTWLTSNFQREVK